MKNTFKGQSAIEYLTTYGWMLLVVAIVGGSIFTTFQNSADIQSVSGLNNAEVQMSNYGLNQGGLKLSLRAAATDQIYIKKIELKNSVTGLKSLIKPKETITVGDTNRLSIESVQPSSTSKNYDIQFTYDVGSLTSKISEGKITGNMQINTLDNDIAAYFKMNKDSPRDSSENNIGVSKNGGVNTSNEGKMLGSYSFDGTDDYIDVSNSEYINQDSYPDRTVSLWIKMNKTDIGREQLIYEEGGYSNGLNFYEINGRLKSGMWSDSRGWSGNWFSKNISENEWYFATLVLREADTLEFYIDGKKINETSSDPEKFAFHGNGISVARVHSETKFEISGDYSGGGKYASMSVDDLRIYNRALSKNQIIGLYQLRTIEE